jgi:Caspase domain
MTLLEPRRHAVLVGSASYEDPEIVSYPTVANSALRLKELFDASDLWNSCRIVRDPGYVADVMIPLRDTALECQQGDTLLVYYIGHAINPRRTQHGDILLALRSTLGNEYWSYLSLYHVYDMMRRSRASSKVLVLDCCYCGPADALGAGGEGTPADPPWLSEASTCVLKAVGRDSIHQKAHPFLEMDPSSPYTAFSGYLISILENGIEGTRDPLQVKDVYNELRRVVSASGNHPEPELLIRNEPWIVFMENRHAGALAGPPADPAQLARMRAATPEELADAWAGDARTLSGLPRALISEYLTKTVPQTDGPSLRRLVHCLHERGAAEQLDELLALLGTALPTAAGAAVRELRRHACDPCARFALAVHLAAVQRLAGVPLHEYSKAAIGD